MGEVLARVEGDPFTVSAAGTALSSIAADVAIQARRLRSLASSEWTGVAADSAHAHIATVPPKLDKAAASYGAAGVAVSSYARALASAQSESDDAIAAAARASADLAAARAARSAAALSDAAAARAAIAGALPPAPATAHRYDAVIDDAARRLSAARTSNDEAHADQRQSASGAAAALHDASRQGIRNQNWWHHVTSDAGHWVATHWVGVLRAMASIATKVATIASIAVLVLAVGGIFFPPLEIAAAAMEGVAIAADAAATLETVTAVASGVSMVADSTLAASGNGRWLAPAEDALNVVPWQAGTALGKLTPKIRSAGAVRALGRLVGATLPRAPLAEFGDRYGGRAISLAFPDAAKFRRFALRLATGLNDAGLEDSVQIMQGSSVTGKSFKTGMAFDKGRRSDLDIAVSGDKVFLAAKRIGVSLREGKSRTGPLTGDQIIKLGLAKTIMDLEMDAQRSVDFMIFRSPGRAALRSQGIVMPRW